MFTLTSFQKPISFHKKILQYNLSCSVLIIGVALLSIVNNAHAQETSGVSKDNKERTEIEKITIEGRSNSAMYSFKSGDFQLAETKFKNNAACALRAERDLQAFKDALKNSQPDGLIPRSPRRTPERCKDRGLQLYMAGLSQLQLNLSKEAENSFERAISLKNRLYDAHYRLALIKLLREDKESAKTHFSKIKEILKVCDDCDVRDEILVRIDYLKKALNGDINLVKNTK